MSLSVQTERPYQMSVPTVKPATNKISSICTTALKPLLFATAFAAESGVAIAATVNANNSKENSEHKIDSVLAFSLLFFCATIIMNYIPRRPMHFPYGIIEEIG